MASYKTIHQTDKERDGGRASREWREMNEPDGWSYNFMDDAATQEWISDVWAGSPVEWAWQFMHRGVLRADFFRYLITLVQGGVYSDVDVSSPSKLS
jgi:alpha 1,6-mannosyltransferase